MNANEVTRNLTKHFIDAVDETTLYRAADGTEITKLVITQRPYTFVQLTLENDQGIMVGNGFSKVCYPDTWNKQTGIEIATAKAAQRLAKSYLS